MSFIPSTALEEKHYGRCPICMEDDVKLYKAECGCIVCEACVTIVASDDPKLYWAGCDFCSPDDNQDSL